MTFFTVERANERIPELTEMLTQLRNQRDDIRDVKAAYDATENEPERHRLRLRIRGMVDQMQAAVVRIDAWGITLRDIDTGLLDFPALVAGRQVWLCWRLGDGPVGHWHGTDEGYASRQPLSELPTAPGQHEVDARPS